VTTNDLEKYFRSNMAVEVGQAIVVISFLCDRLYATVQLKRCPLAEMTFHGYGLIGYFWLPASLPFDVCFCLVPF